MKRIFYVLFFLVKAKAALPATNNIHNALQRGLMSKNIMPISITGIIPNIAIIELPPILNHLCSVTFLCFCSLKKACFFFLCDYYSKHCVQKNGLKSRTKNRAAFTLILLYFCFEKDDKCLLLQIAHSHPFPLVSMANVSFHSIFIFAVYWFYRTIFCFFCQEFETYLSIYKLIWGP